MNLRLTARFPLQRLILLSLCWAALAGRAGADGLHLAWNDCRATGGSSLGSACSSDSGSQSLDAGFDLSAPIDSVIAVEMIVDLQDAAESMPDWWQLAPGGCRFAALQAASASPPHPPCVNMWSPSLTPGLVYTVGEPRWQPNQARIFVAFALPSTSAPLALLAGVLYTAGEIVLSNQGTSSCLGCGGGACLVLNSIRLGRVPLPSQPNRYYDIVTPGAGDANRVGWQAGASCDAVPVRSRSWGQLKALYR